MPIGQFLKYYEYHQLKKIISVFKTNKKQDILTDSSMYSLSRNLMNNQSEIFSVSTLEIEKNSKEYDYINTINFDKFELIILSSQYNLQSNLLNHKLFLKNSNIMIYNK